MDFQRRTLLAIVICVLIWIGYAAFLAPPPPEPKKEPDKVAVTSDDDDAPVSKSGDASATPTTPSATDSKPASPEVAAVKHKLSTELLALEVGNIGGLVKRTELLSPQFRRGGSDVGDDFLALGEKASLAVSFDAEYDDEKLDLQVPRSAGWEVVEKTEKLWGLRYKTLDAEVTANLTLTDGYEGKFTVKVFNRSSKRQSHRMLVRMQHGLAKEESSYDIHRGLCATGEDDIEEFAQGDVGETPGRSQGTIRWAGLDSKYFLQALVPEHTVKSCEVGLNKDGTAMVNTIGSDRVMLEPNEARTYVFGVYFGTKEVERLERYAVVSGKHLEDAVDWGWFGGLTRFLGEKMLWLLRVFYGLTGIWGVAIILLTIVVKVLTLPLTFKQMSSMKRMKEIQPELEALKKKYADDRVRQAQEMQALFQRSGVKPLAGCLPMLVQLPIWIALYAMLNTAVELYREPFLWLPDLTQQDPYYVLPLAMGALMFFQMRMSPSGMDNEQAKMMAWMMPIIFTVMMLFLPSGLGVYIFANVVLSLIQTAIQLRTSPQAAAKKS